MIKDILTWTKISLDKSFIILYTIINQAIKPDKKRGDKMINVRVTTNLDKSISEPYTKKELIDIIMEKIELADNEEIIEIKVFKS